MGKLEDKRAAAARIMNMQDVIANAGFSLMNLDVTPISEQLRHAGPQDVDAIWSTTWRAWGKRRPNP